MKHARKDYNSIQDLRDLNDEGVIPEDEPVFLLRAKDLCAPDVVMYWAERAKEIGASKEMCQMARDHAVAMLDWGERNNRHIPDLPPQQEKP